MAPVDSLELFVTPFERTHNKRTSDIFEGDPLIGWRLKPGLRDVWWDYTLVSTNNARMRAEPSLGPKREGVYRIVSLGDSVTFGYRAPVVYQEYPQPTDGTQGDYPTQTARLLREAGIETESFPMAVPGYSSRQGRLWYEEMADELDADLVTILYGWNDGDLRPVPDRLTFDGDRMKAAGRGVVASSQALAHLSRWWSGRGEREAPPPYGQWVSRSSSTEYLENVMAIARLAAASGAHVVVIAPVYRDPVTNRQEAERIGAMRDALALRCEEEGVAYLVVPELTETGYPANGVYFDQEPIHPKVNGHRLLAERLVGLIRERGWVK